jgi:hypothetical protein
VSALRLTEHNNNNSTQHKDSNKQNPFSFGRKHGAKRESIGFPKSFKIHSPTLVTCSGQQDVSANLDSQKDSWWDDQLQTSSKPAQKGAQGCNSYRDKNTLSASATMVMNTVIIHYWSPLTSPQQPQPKRICHQVYTKSAKTTGI